MVYHYVSSDPKFLNGKEYWQHGVPGSGFILSTRERMTNLGLRDIIDLDDPANALHLMAVSMTWDEQMDQAEE